MFFSSNSAQILSIILSIATIVFFAIFFYLCLSWTDGDKKKKENIFIGTSVSLFYTFKIFLVVFCLVLIASFLLDKPF
jgi:TRAP-type C4-dicarboxylate transport system permease small subunit